MGIVGYSEVREGRHVTSGVGAAWFPRRSAMGLRGERRCRGSRGGPPRLEPETAAYFQRALETLQGGLSEEEMGEEWGGGNAALPGGLGG